MTPTVVIPQSAIETLKTYCQPAVQTGQLPKEHLSTIVRTLKVANSPKTEKDEQKGLMTTAQVAEFFGCSKRTVLRMAEDKRLKAVYLRPGNHKSLRFRTKDVHAIMEGV